MQFDPAITLYPEYDYGYGIMSNLISHSYLSQSYDDDSINKILKKFSNFYSTLIKVSLNHHTIKASRMQSPLTRSDRFHIDLLTISIYILEYPEYPVYN